MSTEAVWAGGVLGRMGNLCGKVEEGNEDVRRLDGRGGARGRGDWCHHCYPWIAGGSRQCAGDMGGWCHH